MASTTYHRRKASAVPATQSAAEPNPLSRLYMNPGGKSPSGLQFGTLRRSYANRTNSAADFGRRKLQPIVPEGDATASPWPITAEWPEVLLPPDADPMLRNPETLLRQADLCAAGPTAALLTYLTLPFCADDKLHVGYERCRSFVLAKLAVERQLATLLILHLPARAGAAIFQPHCHALIVPRRIGPLGPSQAALDEELIRDVGQSLIETMWADHVMNFRYGQSGTR